MKKKSYSGGKKKSTTTPRKKVATDTTGRKKSSLTRTVKTVKSVGKPRGIKKIKPLINLKGK